MSNLRALLLFLVVAACGGASTVRPDDMSAAAHRREAARERIAAYKAPKTVEFRTDLPRNPSGKILRRLLRDEYR